MEPSVIVRRLCPCLGRRVVAAAAAMASLSGALQNVLCEDEGILPPAEETREYRDIYEEVMNQLMEYFDDDGDVEIKIVDLVGSVPYKVRVRRANEFDVHLVLANFARPSLPKSIKAVPGHDGFVYVSRRNPTQPTNNSALGCHDTQGYILPKMVKELVTEAVSKAVDRLEEENGWEVEIRTGGGPAITLVVAEGDMSISIDLVPVFRFSWSTLPVTFSSRRRFVKYARNVNPDSIPWAVIPKTAPDDKRSWTLDFVKLEAEGFRDRKQMKNGIRLLKSLRNKYCDDDGIRGPWCHLSSYMIRTVFLWQDDRAGPNFWSGNSIGDIVLTMIRLLASFLEKGRVADFWCEKYNLMTRASVNPKYWGDMSRALENIADDLETNHDFDETVRFYFTDDE